MKTTKNRRMSRPKMSAMNPEPALSTYFIIFRRDRTLTTARLVMTPQNPWSHFLHDGRLYKEISEGLSNGDHFITTNRALVGFSFILGGDTPSCASLAQPMR
jgi:hypothetical protein